MYGERIELVTTIVTLSPLHVGGALDSDWSAPTREEEIAVVQRDARGAPYIPGSSLKGAFRSLLSGFPETKGFIVDVFGEALDEDTGKPGNLVVHGAEFVSPGPMQGRRERREDLRTFDGSTWGWVSSRTAIDGKTGTAEANKLFKAEVVAPGATFRLRLTINGMMNDIDGAMGDALARLFACLAAPDGIAVGRGKGDGWGRLRLSGPEHVITFDKAEATCIVGGRVSTNANHPDGRSITAVVADKAEALAADGHPGIRRILSLTTRDPFLVKVENPEVERRDDGKGAGNRLVGMRSGDGRPELPGSSVMGALRAEAEWLWAIEKKRTNGREAEFTTSGTAGQPSEPVKRLFGLTADATRDFRKRSRDLTGWAGLLRLVSVENIDDTPPTTKTLSSVRIDRLSAEPFGGGLFTVEAFVEPTFRVVLALDERRSPSANDVKFLDTLIALLTSEGPEGGIYLGHGSNRGFGWFDVTRVEEAVR